MNKGMGCLELVAPASAVDRNGHVNNVQYVQWMQDAAMAHSAQLGWPHERYLQLGKTWIVRSHRIEYLHSAYEGDRLLVYTWVSSFQRIKSLRHFSFQRPADQTVLATASTLFIFCDLSSGRPTTIPEEVVRSYPLVSATETP